MSYSIVLAIEGPEITCNNLNGSDFDSKIHTRITLQSDIDICLVPLNSLVSPCFVIYNQNYFEQNMRNMHTYYRII